MKKNNNQLASTELQCCIDYCETTFKVAEQEVVNTYKCNQAQFSASDLWSIQSQRKQPVVGTVISIY